MKILYIGLPRTSSSLFLNYIFPEIAKDLQLSYFPINKYITKSSNKNISIFENLENIERKLPNKFVFGHVSIFSRTWEFNKINYNFELLKKNFDKDVNILIVIRNPYDFLNSIYLKSVSNLIAYPEDDFFYISKNTQPNDVQKRYNLYNFDYENLIKLYSSYFENVITVKYEEIANMEFINKFGIKNPDFSKYKNIYMSHHINISLTSVEVKRLIKFKKFYKFLKKLNLKYKISKKNYKDNSVNKVFSNKNKYKISKKYIPIEIDNIVNKYNEKNYN